MAYPAVMPGFPLQVYPSADTIAPHTEATLQGFVDNQSAPVPPCLPSIHPVPYAAPMVTPIVALVLPNYMYPTIAPGLPPPQPVYHTETGGFPGQMQPFVPSAFPDQCTFTAPPPFGVQNQFNSQNAFPPQAGYMTPPCYFPPSSETPKALVDGQSRSSTPQSGGHESQASAPLFQSRCSSPLNLLELELSVERQDTNVLSSVEREKGASGNQAKEREQKQVNKKTIFFYHL